MEELCNGLNFLIVDNYVRIFISGEINDELAEDFTSLMYGLEFMKDELDLQGCVISISSPGGLVLSGYSIINTIKSSTLDIYLVNVGVVASIAGVIWLSVPIDKRFAFDNSLFMCHLPSGANENVLEKIGESLKVILQRGFPNSDVQEMMNVETWLSVAEQVSLKCLKKKNIIDTEQSVDFSKIIKTEETSFNIYNMLKTNEIIKNNEDEMKKMNIIDRLKNLKNSILGEEVVVETIEEVIEEPINLTEEEVVNLLIENKLEEVETVEEVVVETIEEVETIENKLETVEDDRVKKLEEEVEALRKSLEIESLKVKNFEDEKILLAKKDFLIKNGIKINEDLLKIDMPVLENAFKSISKKAPELENVVKKEIKDISNLTLSDFSPEELKDMSVNNKDLFLKISNNIFKKK